LNITVPISENSRS